VTESVWDYPRPPRVEACARRAAVEFGGEVIADSQRALRVLETSQAPAIYFPPEDVRMDLLSAVSKRTFCEWKGVAAYFDLVVGGKRSEAAAWAYPDPVPKYAELRDLVAFYPQRVNRCRLGDETVEPNGGDFYGGWITSDIAGPFKGAPGTASW
jgi:uncharacterized protein (DUF427 family)